MTDDHKRALSALFEMVLRHFEIVNFNGPYKPAHGTDLYSDRGQSHHRAAVKVLVEAGLAHPEVHAGVSFYRLDHEARAALGA